MPRVLSNCCSVISSLKLSFNFSICFSVSLNLVSNPNLCIHKYMYKCQNKNTTHTNEKRCTVSKYKYINTHISSRKYVLLLFTALLGRGGGLGSRPIFKKFMSPTPRRKWYLWGESRNGYTFHKYLNIYERYISIHIYVYVYIWYVDVYIRICIYMICTCIIYSASWFQLFGAALYESLNDLSNELM